MNETTPDDEPDHLMRASWIFSPQGRQQYGANSFDPYCFSAPSDLFLILHSTSHAIVERNEKTSEQAPASEPKQATVAELSSLTDDTPPSSMGLDGVFYVYEP